MRFKTVAAALTVSVAFTILQPVTAFAQTGSSGSSSLSSAFGPSNNNKAPAPERKLPEELIVTIIGDILGRGISDKAGFLIGDLGIMTNIGENGEFAIVFGDSWRGPGFGQGEWMSPVGVVAKLNDEGKIEILRPLNDGDKAQQLVKFAHTDGLTLIPSDVINVNGTLYMQGMWNRGIGNVLGTEVWKSTDNGAHWESMGKSPANYQSGMTNLITWEMGQDGYIYQMSSEFKRKDSVFLARFRPEDIATPENHQYYAVQADGTGTWGKTFKPVLSQSVRAGEMNLRYIEGHWVLAMFNAETYSVEVRISKEIARDWNEIKPAQVALGGSWASTQTPENFAQLYGGYIVPGSTLGNMDLVISQWKTSNNSRYMSTQFNVKGLDKFFGIGQEMARPQMRSFAPQAVTAPRVGDDSVITVQETPVSPEAEKLLEPQQKAAEATDFTVVPLPN